MKTWLYNDETVEGVTKYYYLLYNEVFNIICSECGLTVTEIAEIGELGEKEVRCAIGELKTLGWIETDGRLWYTETLFDGSY